MHHKILGKISNFFDDKQFEIIETPQPYDDPLSFSDKKDVDRLKEQEINKANDAVAIAGKRWS